MATEMNSSDVRDRLVDALRLDLVGPETRLDDLEEALSQAPSRWYLTGFLVPLGAEPAQRADEASMEDLDQAGEGGGLDDDVTPEPPRWHSRASGRSLRCWQPQSLACRLLSL